MPNKFERPEDPADALYYDVLCGNIEQVKKAIAKRPELVRGKAVVNGAWSHGGRRCGAEDDVLECLWLIVDSGAAFESLSADAIDSAFKTFPKATKFLFAHGANANSLDGAGIPIVQRMVGIGYRWAVGVLFAHGADLNKKATSGETSLDVAIRLMLPRMACYLRDNGGTQALTKTDATSFAFAETEVQLSSGSRKGEVVWYRADRGYGYVRDRSLETGTLFFDGDDIVGKTPSSIEEGTVVGFTVGHDRFGLYASSIKYGENRD